MKLTPGEAFRLYHIAKIHFKSDDGYINKYGWSMNRIPSFATRKDKHHFIRLARKYKKPQYFQEFLIANFVHNPGLWSGDLISDECDDRYNVWIGKHESLEPTFKSEVHSCLDKIAMKGGKYSSLYSTKDGNRPQIFKYMHQGVLSLETIVILDEILKLTEVLDKRLGDDDPEWRTLRQKIKSYRPLVKWPFKPCVMHLRDAISEVFS